MTRTYLLLIGAFCTGLIAANTNSLLGLLTAQEKAANKRAEEPAVAQKNYELRLVKVGESYETIRFRPKSGKPG
jgi:hypothetical protein